MSYKFFYDQKSLNSNYPLFPALFLFIRNYAYIGMFRYSASGDFNVTYGGIAYNNKTMKKKLEYYRSKPLQEHFLSTEIFHLDFEQFLRESKSSESDYIFLDTPYDSGFSTLAQNDFTKADQERLANYIINECRENGCSLLKIRISFLIYSINRALKYNHSKKITQ